MGDLEVENQTNMTIFLILWPHLENLLRTSDQKEVDEQLQDLVDLIKLFYQKYLNRDQKNLLPINIQHNKILIQILIKEMQQKDNTLLRNLFDEFIEHIICFDQYRTDAAIISYCHYYLMLTTLDNENFYEKYISWLIITLNTKLSADLLNQISSLDPEKFKKVLLNPKIKDIVTKIFLENKKNQQQQSSYGSAYANVGQNESQKPKISLSIDFKKFT